MSDNRIPPSPWEDDYDPMRDAAEENASDLDAEQQIHAWCPYCGGVGMVPAHSPLGSDHDDCPNLNLHRFLVQINGAWIAQNGATA